MQLAIALYNNNVDDEDELEFRKGDILTVLIENPNGFDGWWLCKHKNRCGLCPENRLKLIHNTESSSINYYSRFSTISMYDSLSNNYNNSTRESSLVNHDYNNRQKSDFISNLKSFDSSPESSSRSSGIYSANDPHSSSSLSSMDLDTTIINNQSLSLFDLNQLQNSFKKLSIRSLIIDKYRQLISKTNVNSTIDSFITECYLFLHHYGCLLDRYTYRLIKDTFLFDLEHQKKRIIQSSTKIIQLIKLTIDLRLKEKSPNYSSISNDVFNKLHLQPIAESVHEKMPISLSTTQIYGNFSNKNHQSLMKNSKTYHSTFLTTSKFDYGLNSLIKCYYRHINEQSNSIIKHYSYLLENENTNSSLLTEGKALVVAGHKLVFVLETLHEHLQQIQTPLIHLTTELRKFLTNSIHLLKQFSQQNCTNIPKLMIQFKQDIKMIMNIVTCIQQNCSLA